MKRLIVLACFTTTLFLACKNNTANNSNDTSVVNTIPPPSDISYSIVATYPHDTTAFTEGLQWINNSLYEGTGLEGESQLKKVNLTTGKTEKSVTIDPSLFGEGITLLNDKIYELTWQNHKVFVYDATTLKKLKELTWEHEGWGMTTNGKDLIISTGDSNLYIVDPETFKIKNIIAVMDNNGPLGNINELEYVDGMVYANVYQTDYIVKIDLATGRIVSKANLSGLLKQSGMSYNPASVDVLNGIAYNAAKKTFYITGKKWPALFEMKLN